MRRRSEVYLDILSAGLLAVRSAAYNGDAAWCYAEADHLHNVPNHIKCGDDALHRFYLNVERPAYLRAMGTKYKGAYDALWAELERAPA
jgi:hypothetical protein